MIKNIFSPRPPFLNPSNKAEDLLKPIMTKLQTLLIKPVDTVTFQMKPNLGLLINMQNFYFFFFLFLWKIKCLLKVKFYTAEIALEFYSKCTR